jgi:hypothetical protein
LVSGANSSLLSANQSVPDSDGTWTASAGDINTGVAGNEPETGQGILERLTLRSIAPSVAGFYSLRLTDAGHIDPGNVSHAPDAINDAKVAIDSACPLSEEPGIEGAIAPGPGGWRRAAPRS